MQRAFGYIFAAALCAASLAPERAKAGAFTLDQGEAKLFVFGLVSSGDRYFDRDGRLRSRGRYSKRDLQAYAEYGVVEGLTVFGATALQRIKSSDGGAHEHRGVGRSEFGARARLFAGGGWVASVQASGAIAGADERGGLAVIGETDDQVDARGQVARSFEAFGMTGFVDLAAGYRYRSGDPADEVRLDATFGVRPIPRLLLLAQSFNTIGVGRWSGVYELKQRIYKLQGAVLYDLTERTSLFAAAFFTPVGRDALDERGGAFGLAFRF